MEVRIFDVEHEGCALITADTGLHTLIDCGHNSTSGWRPSIYLLQRGIKHISRLVITNFDEDHASDLHNLRAAVDIDALYRNGSVSPSQLLQLKELGGVGRGIQSLKNMMETYTRPVQERNFCQLSFEYFYNNYPQEFEDENNLSLVAIFRYKGLNIAFPGDLEVAGWEQLLERDNFVRAMSDINVFVASHHGRENGCSQALYDKTGMYPEVTVISDSGIEYATQETINWYRERTRGITLNGENRRVLTTRRDGRVKILSDDTGSYVDVLKV